MGSRSAKASSRRRVTLGATTASPLATARMAVSRSGRRHVLEQESAGAGLQSGEGVFVEVERGQDQDPRSAAGATIRRVASTPSSRRHPHVHEHDVHLRLGDLRNRLRAVSRLHDDRDVFAGVDHHGQTDADQLLVVDQPDSDRHLRDLRYWAGNSAHTRNPLSVGPASKVPPAARTRSWTPRRPVPVPGTAGRCSASPPSSIDDDDRCARRVRDRDGDRGTRSRMLDAVGQCFLDQAVRGRDSGRRHRIGRALHDQTRIDTRRANPFHQRRYRCERGLHALSRRLLSQQLQRASHIGQSLPGGVGDDRQRLTCTLRRLGGDRSTSSA